MPVLKELSEKYPLVLVSNFYGNVETVLKDFGIDTYFKEIIESAVVGVRNRIRRFSVSAWRLSVACRRKQSWSAIASVRI